jgi:hypothetical protein
MKNVALFLLLLVPLAAQPPSPAKKAAATAQDPALAKAAAAFAIWWKPFQEAVVKQDAASVSKGAKFPMQWENGPTREIQVATAIQARFAFYFTADIRSVIASQTPVLSKEGASITWKARGNEYSLYFKDRGTGWALDGLSEGPP